jgi:hypothetical protein
MENYHHTVFTKRENTDFQNPSQFISFLNPYVLACVCVCVESESDVNVKKEKRAKLSVYLIT